MTNERRGSEHRRTGRGAALAATAALVAIALHPARGQDGGAPPERSVWDGIYSAEQAARGAELYTTGCAECHGEGLAGDDMSPALVGSDFLWDWTGLSVGDLFERLVLSMPDANPKSMSPQEKADVLAFVLQQNELPAGEAELPASKEELEGIAIVATRPEGD